MTAIKIAIIEKKKEILIVVVFIITVVVVFIVSLYNLLKTVRQFLCL